MNRDPSSDVGVPSVHSSRSLLGVLTCLALLAGPARAQATERLRREAEFLRRIAGELGFTELALDEVARLAAASGSDAERQLLRALEVELLAAAARQAQASTEKRRWFTRASARSDAFLEAWRTGPHALMVHRSLVEALEDYGPTLDDDLELAALQDPARQLLLAKTAAELYRRGVESCDALLADRAARPGWRDSAEHLRFRYRKVVFLRERARLVPGERESLCREAHGIAEEIVLGSDPSGIGEVLLLELARLREVLGELDEAARAYQECAEAAFKAATASSTGLKGEALEIVVRAMEQSYERLTATLLAQRKHDAVLTAATEYRKRSAEIHGVSGHDDPRLGALIRTAEAEALAAKGQRAKALTLARSLLESHDALVAARAKRLLDRLAR